MYESPKYVLIDTSLDKTTQNVCLYSNEIQKKLKFSLEI